MFMSVSQQLTEDECNRLVLTILNGTIITIKETSDKSKFNSNILLIHFISNHIFNDGVSLMY